MPMTGHRSHAALVSGKAGVFSVVCLVVLATSSWAERVFELGIPEATAFSTRRRVRYGYEVRNTGNAVVRNAKVWVAAPVRQNATQWCRRIALSHHAVLVVDQHDNQALEIMIEQLPPYGSTIFTVEAELLLRSLADGYSKGGGLEA